MKRRNTFKSLARVLDSGLVVSISGIILSSLMEGNSHFIGPVDWKGSFIFSRVQAS
jgi:hypothetical protein